MASWVQGSEFPGWQALRVIEQDGRPYVVRAADLDGDGRQELVVVNSRFSRLDIFSWTPHDRREKSRVGEVERPNDLPLPPDITRREIQLEHLPQDCAIVDVDGDKKAELAVLVSPPNRLVVFRQGESDNWISDFDVDLLDGEIGSRRGAMLVSSADDGSIGMLVSFDEGIQKTALRRDARPSWLTPREKRGRSRWWLADLDGDQLDDIIEQSSQTNASIRWLRQMGNHSFAPAQTLFDRAINGAEALHRQGAAHVALLDGAVEGLVRRYELGRGDQQPLGDQFPLPLAAAQKTPWCGMHQGTDVALVVADPERPQLLSYVLGKGGWQSELTYPAVGNVAALAAPSSAPGVLLLWAKGAADLLRCHWTNDRLTYPEKWVLDDVLEPRKIVSLGSTGSTVWWVQQVGKHLDLYLWARGDEEPTRKRWENVGAKVEEALWIGGERLLVKEQHARGLQLVAERAGKAAAIDLPVLKAATLSEYKLIPLGEEFRLAKLTEGVLQWLDDELQSIDQVMLPQGEELSDYVGLDASHGWAVQRNAPYAHRMEAANSGLLQSVDRWKLPAVANLVHDPVLGLVLVGHDQLTRVTAGRQCELQLIDLVDQRVAREQGVRETKAHRMGAVDLDGDGNDELVLFDDLRHRLTVLSSADGSLKPVLSWPVFDDNKYPYDESTEELVREPRALQSLDFDGDGRPDLALLCHDRLLLYLAREQP